MKDNFEKSGLGFNEIVRLAENEEYTGDADFVMFIGDESQVAAAEAERSREHGSERVDLVICQHINKRVDEYISSGKKGMGYIYGEPSGVEGD